MLEDKGRVRIARRQSVNWGRLRAGSSARMQLYNSLGCDDEFESCVRVRVEARWVKRTRHEMRLSGQIMMLAGKGKEIIAIFKGKIRDRVSKHVVLCA